MGDQRVLVVDDDRDLCDLVSDFLTEEGYAVTRAYSGQDALAAIRLRPPDILVLDLLLPDISGLAVARQIRRDTRTVGLPIIVASGDGVALHRAQEIAPATMLVKPFTLTDLGAAVRKAVGNGRPPG